MVNQIRKAACPLEGIDALRARLVDQAGAVANISGSPSPSVTGLTIAPTTFAGLTIYRHTSPTSPDAVTYEPSIAVVVQGSKRADLGDISFTYNQSRFLITSLDLPVSSQVIEATREAPYLCMLLKFRMPLVREVLSRAEIRVAEAGSDDPAMATGKSTPELLGAFSRLLDLVLTQQDTRYLGGLIEREIIYRILQGSESQRLRAIATRGDQSQRTARAIAWIMANYVRPLNVEHLAEVAGMGISTLHRHFRALTAMSPLQYQKNLRLHAARRKMLTEGIDAASAAYAVGYESPSQFSREYSRRFGKPPMRDVQMLLTNGPASTRAATLDGVVVESPVS